MTKEMSREISKFFGINPLEQVLLVLVGIKFWNVTAHRTIYAKWYM